MICKLQLFKKYYQPKGNDNMSEENSREKKGLYCWAVGEVALARICKSVYGKVRISKNEDGIFFDRKVLGMSVNKDGSLNVKKELCYFVETLRSQETLWLPYTSLHLAERSRPFYGRDKALQPVKPPSTPKKRKIKEDHPLPMSIGKLAKTKTPDLNLTLDIRHLPMKVGKYENAFKEFLRRGKDMIFDEFFFLLQKDEARIDEWEYIMNVDASTEDKFETVIRNVMTEKEAKNYLKNCWRYNYVKEMDNTTNPIVYSSIENYTSDSSAASTPSPVKKAVTVHTTWCLVCGQRDRLSQCVECPATYHVKCLPQWKLTVFHRKSPPTQVQAETATIHKVLSSTRTIVAPRKGDETTTLCPSCLWGPGIGYGDVVWHKIGMCPWWPARVLSPGTLPPCLLARKHDPHQWPLQYYGDLKYSWADATKMCLFLPSHPPSSGTKGVSEAALDAADDYIAVYLT